MNFRTWKWQVRKKTVVGIDLLIFLAEIMGMYKMSYCKTCRQKVVIKNMVIRRGGFIIIGFFVVFLTM